MRVLKDPRRRSVRTGQGYLSNPKEKGLGLFWCERFRKSLSGYFEKRVLIASLVHNSENESGVLDRVGKEALDIS